MNTSKTTEVRIKLPLPGDVAMTIQRAVGVAYPRTELKLGTGDEMVLLVKDSDRDARIKAGPVLEVIAEPRDQDEPDLLGMDEQGVTLGAVAGANAWVVSTLGAALAEAGATNYIETKYTHRGDSYVAVVARSEEQTPHELRLAAEERARDAEHRVAELERLVSELSDELANR